eukprot:scaffold117586_cov33-Tisochrysis_lutea.AAC.5
MIELLQEFQVPAVIPDLKTPDGQAHFLSQPLLERLHVRTIVIALSTELEQVFATIAVRLPVKAQVGGLRESAGRV